MATVSMKFYFMCSFVPDLKSHVINWCYQISKYSEYLFRCYDLKS